MTSPATADPAPGTRGQGFRAFYLLLFILSGAAGLMYQVIWVRRLTIALGASAPAVAVVLAYLAGAVAFQDALANLAPVIEGAVFKCRHGGGSPSGAATGPCPRGRSRGESGPGTRA